MFEEFIWYFTEKPCIHCKDFCKCDCNLVDGDEQCITNRLVRIVFYGNGDCWEEKKGEK